MGTFIALIPVAVWTYLLVGRGGFWRIRPRRIPLAPLRHNVAAVIPARDEAASIAAAISSLTAQHLPVIVVDDHSSDATARIARENGATVLTGALLPGGWIGKMWAVAQGVDFASQRQPDYLLLTDADIVHAPGSIPALAALAAERGIDLVSLMVLLRTESFAERALLPAFVFFFLMLYPPAWIENPKYRAAAAAGGCILIRRETLERIGGIPSIRAELIDDCALARAVKRSGGKVWLGLTSDTRSIRAYHGPGEIWRMISRTAFTQLHHSPLHLCAALVGLVVTYMAPPLFAIAGPRAPGAAAWLMMSIAYAPMLRVYRRSLLWAPALPLIAVFYAAATLDSAIRYWTGRGGMWKGRSQAPPRPTASRNSGFRLIAR